MRLPERKKPIDVPPIDFHWQSGTATIEWIVRPDRKTGIGSGLIRYLNYERCPDNLPYRGVTTIAIKNWVFEFKGACFWRKGDCPFRVEHEDIKDHLTNPDPKKGWGMEGFALRQKPDGRIVVKRYRWRNKGAVIVLGNSAKTNCGEMKMATRTFVVSWKLINDETGKQEAAGSLESNGRALAEVRHMQNLLKSGYQEPVEAIGDELAAAQAAA